MNTPATADAIAAARLLLQRMGLAPADLIAPAPTVSTFADFAPQVCQQLSEATLGTYGTHLDRLATQWLDRRLDEPTTAELTEMARAVQTSARTSRASRGGSSAAEHFVSAVRCLYRHAETRGWIRPADNPARQLTMPTRHPSKRYAIPSGQLAKICTIAAATGDDPELDSLLLRLHTETACRRSGALALRPHDLDPDQCLIHLQEKEGIGRWQPVSPTLMRHLIDHADTRNSPHSAQLLRYRNGRPITARRYDHLWKRIGQELPWVARHGITTHWLRHTTLTWVERTFGYAVARAYAGHFTKNTGTTTTYVKAHLHEIAAALAVLTREPHPLAPNYRPPTK